MLEEVLSSSSADPADTARAFLQYLKYELPAGGPDAEYRFCQKLYPLLLCRIFGFLDTPENQYRHQVGGWLSRQARWNVVAPRATSDSFTGGPFGAAASHGAIHMTQGTLSMDPVIQLLSPPKADRARTGSLRARLVTSPRQAAAGQQGLAPDQPTLISLLSIETHTRPVLQYEFPFCALPTTSQRVIMELIKSACTDGSAEGSCVEGTDNEISLYGSLLQVKPVDQSEIVELFKLAHFGIQPTKAQHSAIFSPRSWQGDLSPQLQPQQQTEQDLQLLIQKKASETMLMLSGWEMYFFFSLRFPFAKPLPQKSTAQPVRGHSLRSPSPGTIASTAREPYGDTVYSQLFKLYVDYYLPHGTIAADGEITTAFHSNSELFVRLVADFWMNGQNLPLTNTQLAEQRRQRQYGRQSEESKTGQGLAAVFDNVQLSTLYVAYPSLVDRGLRYLVTHVCSDPLLEQRMSVLAKSGMDPKTVHEIQALGMQWILSPQMLLLQLPIFNCIRAALRYAPLTGPTSPFVSAVELWLTWIEPWNYVAPSK